MWLGSLFATTRTDIAGDSQYGWFLRLFFSMLVSGSVVLVGLFLLPEHAHSQGGVEPIPASQLPPEVALDILHRSLHEAVWGPPMHCQLRQEVLLNSHKMTGQGHFLRGGQGKLRMSLQLVAGNRMNNLLQVSNGELMYTKQEVDGESHITRIDLGRVRERLVITTGALTDPTLAMYLAIGGQAELLRKLCQQYRWYHVEAGEVGGIPVWWLRGTLTNQPAAVRALAEVDHQTTLPDRFAFRPTDAEIAIGRENAPVPFWLYEVKQSRSQNATSQLDYATELSVKLEFANPTPPSAVEMSAEQFDFWLGNEHFTEETKLYLPPTASAGAAHPMNR